MIDPAQAGLRAQLVSRMLRLHGGGIEVVSIDAGKVTLTFTGLCTACWMRPVTLENVIRPAFLDLEGVTEVSVQGVRLSDEAQRRLAGARAAQMQRRRGDTAQLRGRRGEQDAEPVGAHAAQGA